MRPVRTAIIGAGAVVSMYLDNGLLDLQTAGEVDLRIAFSRNRERAEALAARIGGHPCTDLSAVLESTDIEAVIVATPHASHAEIVLAATAAGKHVLVEKPMALDLSQAREMVAAAAAAGVVLGVFENYQFVEPLLIARKMVAEGVVGQLALVRAQRTAYLADVWLTNPWRAAKGPGGGIIIDQLCHQVRGLRLVSQQEVTHVSAMATSARPDFEAEDTAVVNLKLASGLLGQVALTWAARIPAEPELRLDGAEGSLDVFRWPDGRIVLRRADLPGGSKVLVERSDIFCFRETFLDFFRACREETEIAISGEEGFHDLAVVEAVRRSLATGRVEEVPVLRPRE
ncbi:MAG: Gfo/Idh/MocA family oxidoreductase [Dehalococcoidales bacterium]|nr:Gfo/Idh/MocA family oxidoreductase [Dehalococcoidales bacterium]